MQVRTSYCFLSVDTKVSYKIIILIALGKDTKQIIYDRTKRALSETYMHNNCCIVCERDIPKWKTKFIKLHDSDGNAAFEDDADENKYPNLISVRI